MFEQVRRLPFRLLTMLRARHQRSPWSFLLLLCLACVKPLHAQCPAGYTLYTDSDGSEGGSTCYKYHTPGVTFASAQTGCSNQCAGFHLITFKASAKSGSLISTLLTAYGAATPWIGCVQSASTALRSNWYWMDGTSATSLNCASSGCGLWSGEPRDSDGFENGQTNHCTLYKESL
jgi:hypothetical protein